MQIDRSNYEILLIDWLDGKLDDIEVAQLKLFLQKNPDIKEEYDELTMFRLRSPGEPFHQKNNLKKTTSTLPVSQFEYLCVAFLENDLSSEQLAELNEIIEEDLLKKQTFDLIRKTKLSPSEDTFKHKKGLIRRTFAQNFIRFSVIGLSAAAITALLIGIYVLNPGPLPVKPEITAKIAVPTNKVQDPSVTKFYEKEEKGDKTIRVRKVNQDLLALSERQTFAANESNSTAYAQPDSMIRMSDIPYSSVNKIPVSFDSELIEVSLPNNLIALSQAVIVPDYDDGRSKLSRLIARTFREKILKEKTAKDSPIKGYEIAEAGVTGLNKLLGWEMALDEKKDEKGELKSVYFSSKILKFNAPVKKSEPLQ